MAGKERGGIAMLDGGGRVWVCGVVGCTHSWELDRRRTAGEFWRIL